METLPHLPQNRRAIGTTAEGTASEYLQHHGYQILQRNIYTPFGELDIMAKKGGVFVCVEVRSRASARDLPPELSLTYRKYQHLIRSILSISWLHNQPVRLDLVTVVAGKVAGHYKDVRITQVASRHKLAYAV